MANCGGVRRENVEAMTYPNGYRTVKGGEEYTVLLYEVFAVVIKERETYTILFCAMCQPYTLSNQNSNL
jgi:hypothetical protein